jgi:Skp family chaperone for outer membrane proteins
MKVFRLVLAALIFGSLTVAVHAQTRALTNNASKPSNLSASPTDIQNKRQVQDPKITAQQTDQADKLELELKRRAEDAQAASNKEMESALSPLQQDIQNALGAYAKAHGIFLVIDAGRVPLVYADDSIDITKDFIADYNKTHPATRPAAPAKP